MSKKRKKKTKQVESLMHRDKRKNIPTEELRDFGAEDEEKLPVVLYPRNPSLDPQLVKEAAKDAVPALNKALEDEDGGVRDAAAEASRSAR